MKTFIHTLRAALLAGLLAFTALPRAHAAPGDLDTTFGTGGQVTTTFGTSVQHAKAIAVQSDGKLVVAGYAQIGSNVDFAVVRYNLNGSLDSTFNGSGKVTTDIAGGSDQGYGVVIQTDGKIIVAGTGATGGGYDFAVVRYNSNGSLDTSFGGTGKVTVPVGSGVDNGYSVALQADGKVVVAGTAEGSPFRIGVVRLNANGTLDATFNGSGKVITAIGSSASGNAVRVQEDGKIVVAGGANTTGNGDVALVRYNSDGSLDTSFGGTGVVTTAIGTSHEFAKHLAIQPDGKIVAAGASYDGTGKPDFAVLRYNVSGSLDPTFNGTGKIVTPLSSAWDVGNSLALQGDGRIVVAGYSDPGGFTEDFAVARYNIDGTLDSSFGTGGFVTTSLSANRDFAWGVALQIDGKIVAVGTANDGPAAGWALVRYEGVQTDTITDAPTLTAPASNAMSGNPVSVAFTLPEAALNGSVTLSFGSTVLTLANTQGTAGAHSFTFNPANPTASAQIASGSPVADGTYTVTLSYQDALGNPAASTVSTNVTIDMTTQAATLMAPTAGALYGSLAPVDVAFTLPEAAQAGSVKLTFDDGMTQRVLTLAGTEESSGAHSFSFAPANPTASAQITSGPALATGVYTVSLSYQDALGNAVASSASVANVEVDLAPPGGGTFSFSPASPVTTDTGVSLLASGWSELHGPISYRFFLGATPLGAAGASNTHLMSPLAVGSYTVSVEIADALGNVTTEGPLALVVQEAPPTDPVLSEIAGKGGVAAGLTNAKFVSFGNPAINGEGRTAFFATVTGNTPADTTALMGKTKGIWADDSTGTRQLIVRVGDTAVGTSSAVFSAMTDPVYNANEEIAFKGTLKVGVGGVTSTPTLTANNFGVWSNTGGTLHLVAQRGAQAPGCPVGATFSAFTSVALPDQGGVVMLANLNSGTVALPGPGGVTGANNIGIWAVDSAGDLQLVVRKGDIHPATGKAITALSFLPAPSGVSAQSRSFSQSTGDLLYRASFSDGTSGVFRITASTSLVAGQVIVDDQFTTSTGRPLPPQILTSTPQNVNLPGGVWSGKGAVGLGAYGTPDILSLGSKQVLKLTGDIGAVVPLASNGGYTKPTLIRLQTTFNLGTTTGLGTTRSAGLGFWSSAAEGLANSYLGFYGVTVDRNGSVKLNLNPSDFTPLVTESLPNAGDWSASAWHTLAFSVNTNTGEIFDVMMDGIFYNFVSPVSAFTNANTNYAGILVSSDASEGNLFVDSFQVSEATSGLQQPVVMKGARAAGITDAKFTSFGYPAMNDEGHTAFFATVTGTDKAATTALLGKLKGIWADDSSGIRQLIARVGDTAVDTSSAVFSAMSDPVYNGNEEIAFRGTLKAGVGDTVSTPKTSANHIGIWSNTGGTLHLVARGAGQAPGCPAGATFATFTSTALPDQGGVVMFATLNIGTGGVDKTNNIGIWAVDTDGVLQLIARTGAEIGGKVITKLSFLPVASGVSGQTRSFIQSTGDLLYKATFADGSSGIYKVVFP